MWQKNNIRNPNIFFILITTFICVYIGKYFWFYLGVNIFYFVVNHYFSLCIIVPKHLIIWPVVNVIEPVDQDQNLVNFHMLRHYNIKMVGFLDTFIDTIKEITIEVNDKETLDQSSYSFNSYLPLISLLSWQWWKFYTNPIMMMTPTCRA